MHPKEDLHSHIRQAFALLYALAYAELGLTAEAKGILQTANDSPFEVTSLPHGLGELACLPKVAVMRLHFPALISTTVARTEKAQRRPSRGPAK